MMTRNKITNGLTVAVVAMGIVVCTAQHASAQTALTVDNADFAKIPVADAKKSPRVVLGLYRPKLISPKNSMVKTSISAPIGRCRRSGWNSPRNPIHFPITVVAFSLAIPVSPSQGMIATPAIASRLKIRTGQKNFLWSGLFGGAESSVFFMIFEDFL